ncbi:translocation/assembly module TamB domain-containing protein [Synechocystis sp. PCC 7509]|uniref:translocation/assembly module TamB domain-containing protein n=1 Tax=Synechocystis sp. PCC 7509 TaxID=927677 RepID=UPI0002ACFDEC|nr:translocation/assembly module TamB domain-containing protein [Synechocystis sp. PCC 7509]
MTKLSKPDSQTTSKSRQRFWFILLGRTGIYLGIPLLIGTVGGAWWLWVFVQERLAPIVQTNLIQTLNRDVQLGQVERVSLTSLRFGKSAIPATKSDRDRAAVDAVEVKFDLWQLAFTRTLKLDITLINPDVYIDQDSTGHWIATTVASQESEGAFKTQLDNIRVQNANVVLAPNIQTKGKNQVQINISNGSAQLLENNQLVKYNLNGQFATKGSISIQGETRPKTEATNIQLRAQDVLASEVTRLIKLPLELQAGRVSGNLKVQSQPQQPTLLFGTVNLNSVTAQVRQLPQAFNKANGTLRFKDTLIGLDKITTSYGLIAATANGSLDTQRGYNISAVAPSVTIALAQKTLKLELPVPVSGTVRANVQLVGALETPILSGTVVNTKTTRIDKVNFSKIRSEFAFAPAKSVIALRNIQAIPAAGGQITGNGIIKLGKTPQLGFDTVARNIPGDAIARLYNVSPQFKLGRVSAKTLVGGKVGNLQTIVNWQAPQASYPGSGQIVINNADTFTFRNTRLSVAGGAVQAAGSLEDGVLKASVIADKVRLGQITSVPPALQAPLSGRFNVSGAINSLTAETLTAEGVGQLAIGGGTVTATNIQLNKGNWQAVVRPQNVQLGSLVEVPPQLRNGRLTGAFNAAGTTASFQPKAIALAGIGRLNIGGGTVVATNIRLNQGNWQAVVRPQNVRLGSLVEVPPQFRNGRLTAIFKAAGTTASFQPKAIAATGIGRLKIAEGTVTATNIQLNKGNWQALVQAQAVQLQQIVPTEVPPQFRGRVSGVFQAAGTTESFELNAISATGRGQLNAASGTIVATNIALNKGNFQALASPSQLQLSQFSPDLRGRLNGQLQVTGNVAAFSLAGVKAQGQVRLSQGVSLVTQPLTAAIEWDGRKITVLRATSADTLASGVVFVNPQIPAIESLNLQVQAKNYALQDLPFELPNNVNLAGRGDFAGRISGTLPTPNVVGAVRLRNLVVNNLAFEPVLTGNLQVATSSGVNLEVKGNSDRIALNLDTNYFPNSFTLQRDRAVATGRTSGENLLVNIENFPLAILKLRLPNTVLGSEPVAGLLTGDFTINKQTFAVAGNVAISQPVLGRLKGEEFTGGFAYNNGAVSLTDARFKIGESLYAATGSYAPNASGAPEVKGQLKVTKGKVTDAIAAFQLISLQNSQGEVSPTPGGANSLNTEPVGLPGATLLAQLRRYSEINMLLQLQQQQRRTNSPAIPKLEDLEGIFNADIAINGSVPNGLSVKFDIDGTDWKLGNYYTANQVIAQGSFMGGVLTFAPLRLQSDQSLVAFSGQIGGTRQAGQLQVNNFPLEALNSFVKLPIDVTGNLNAQATLTGQLTNPQVAGNLSLINGTLNRKVINSAAANFGYNNARLSFDSTIEVDSPEPVTISGNVPVPLPFVTVKSKSDRITLDINVQDSGLALLNLFTDQIAWQSGQGKVQLQVRGTLNQPVATGVATVSNATFTAQALPEPLTNVNGSIDFDFDRLQVENLQGNFSQGQVVAAGVLPIFRSLVANDPDLSNPLTFNLDKLALNLKGLYRGGASGNVVVKGAVLSPVIGGEVLLADGQVLLGETQGTTPSSSQQVANSLRPATANQASASPEFNNLQLTLGDNIAITRQPILQFQAGGTLTLNGSLDDIRPQGNIRLRSGGINLFTTQFVLARGYENQATFIPDRGLDPTLDVRLVARVPEVTQSRVPSSPISSEISETLATDFGSLRTVRVQARVQGPASQIFDNLELTSDPNRSQNEIIALIGGGFVDTLGRGDSTLGLANLAGSAILGNFQGTFSRIGNAIGLDELRLFPTVTTSEESRNSTLGLAAEGNVDLSNNLSVSVLRILTTNEPTQFGLSYRLSDRVRIRASTNLNAESLAIFEYQNNF